MLAFFSLAQQVRVSATELRHRPAASSSASASRTPRPDLRSDLNRLGREPAIRKLAIDAGLGQLAEPIVLPAR